MDTQLTSRWSVCFGLEYASDLAKLLALQECKICDRILDRANRQVRQSDPSGGQTTVSRVLVPR